MQACLLCKTRKLSSGFSKTQMSKFSKNSVFVQKLSSKVMKNSVFQIIFTLDPSKHLRILTVRGSFGPDFWKTQFQKHRNSVVLQKFAKVNSVKFAQKQACVMSFFTVTNFVLFYFPPPGGAAGDQGAQGEVRPGIVPRLGQTAT